MKLREFTNKLFDYGLSLIQGKWYRFETPIILYYHRVIDYKINNFHLSANPSICIPKDLFSKQIEFLATNTNILTLDEFAHYFLNKKHFPEISVLITFDDGYLDNYQNAFPILKANGVSATIFLTSSMIESEKRFWWDQLYVLLDQINTIYELWEVAEKLEWQKPFSKEDLRLPGKKLNSFKNQYFNILNDRMKFLSSAEIEDFLDQFSKVIGIKFQQDIREFLNWNEINEMSRSKIYFGSHTHNHPNLKLLTDSEIFSEFALSKEIIEKQINQDILTLSFPSGLFDKRCKKILEQCNYKLAFQTRPKVNSWDRFSIPRIPIKTKRSLGFKGHFSPKLFRYEFTGRLDKNYRTFKKFYSIINKYI